MSLEQYMNDRCTRDNRYTRFPPLPRPAVSVPSEFAAGLDYTYLVGIEGSPLVKIGHAKDPRKRLRFLQTGHPMLLSLLWTYPVNYETALHDRFDHCRVRGEWFDLTPVGDPVAVVDLTVRYLAAPDAATATSSERAA